MAHYFDCRQEVCPPFEVRISKWKKVVCAIFKEWVDRHIYECSCGLNTPFKVTRTWGVSQRDSTAFESSLESSIGKEGIAQLKSSIKSSSNHEIELSYSQSEEMSYNCEAPRCGCVQIRVSQLIHEYNVALYRRGFLFRSDVWDRVWSEKLVESLPCYSATQDASDYDKRCEGCTKRQSPEFDGRISLDLGDLSLLLPYKAVGRGVLVQVLRDVVEVPKAYKVVAVSKWVVSLRREQIHPALLFLGNVREEESVSGMARIWGEGEEGLSGKEKMSDEEVVSYLKRVGGFFKTSEAARGYRERLRRQRAAAEQEAKTAEQEWEKPTT